MSSQRVDIHFTAGKTEARETFRIISGAPQGEVVGSLAENLIGTPVSEYYITYRNVPSDPSGDLVRALQVKVRLRNGAAKAGVIALNIICSGNAKFGTAI